MYKFRFVCGKSFPIHSEDLTGLKMPAVEFNTAGLLPLSRARYSLGLA
jgi:hypothetical protein